MKKHLKSIIAMFLLAVMTITSSGMVFAAEPVDGTIISSEKNTLDGDGKTISPYSINYIESGVIVNTNTNVSAGSTIATVDFKRTVRSVRYQVYGSSGSTVIFRLTNLSTGSQKSFTATADGASHTVSFSPALSSGQWRISVVYSSVTYSTAQLILTFLY